MKKILLFIPLAIFLLLAASLLLAIRHSNENTSKFAVHIGEPAPTTRLPILGQPDMVYATEDWHGHPYIVSFFASWCVPCHAEHPLLLELSKHHIPIIGIAHKDKPEAIDQFLRKEGDPYVAAADDGNGRAGLDWGITGIPETFLIDGDGIIRFHSVGPMTKEVIEQELLPAWHDLTP